MDDVVILPDMKPLDKTSYYMCSETFERLRTFMVVNQGPLADISGVRIHINENVPAGKILPMPSVKPFTFPTFAKPFKMNSLGNLFPIRVRLVMPTAFVRLTTRDWDMPSREATRRWRHQELKRRRKAKIKADNARKKL